MLRLETGSPGEGSEVRLWGRVTAQRGYCRGQGDLDEDVGSGGGWPQPGPTGAQECKLDQSCSRWAGLAFTPLGQSSGRGLWAAFPLSPQWSQTSLVQRAFVHEGSSGRGGGGGHCELFAATPPAVGGEHPVQDRL